jgi:UDP:flavonoid glycosyltransferase YjiC (YdhE family)
MKVMFSIHVGDSLAHLYRTRGLASKMISDGNEIKYVVPRRVHKYLNGYLPKEAIVDDSQNFGFSRLETIDNLIAKFCEKAASEYYIYKSFRPDVVIGDMGLTASVYCIDKILIKILNRFPLEIASGASRFLTTTQRNVIVSQIEDMINQARKILGIDKYFEYSEFLSSNTIIHGFSLMAEYIMPNMVPIGYMGRLQLPKSFDANPSNVFISLGTGVSENKDKVLNSIINTIEAECEKIYIGLGKSYYTINNKFPKKADVRPIFKEFPSDAGCLICHGGYGILHSGLLAGVRIHTFPFHIEHLCNSERLVALRRGCNHGYLKEGIFKGLSHEIEYDYEGFFAAYKSRQEIEQNSLSQEQCTEEKLFRAVSMMLK